MDRARRADGAAAALSAPDRLRAVLGGSVGNLVEWYDWFAYPAFTLYFAPRFFPKGDQTAQLLQAAAVFAVGFLARPIGAWATGLYADRAGRRAALAASVALMSAGAFAIALIPDYGRIGPAAPVLLTLARLVQGLSLGGEYGASATYMMEAASPGRRGFWSSVQFAALIVGQLIAMGLLVLLQHLLSPAALESWGWRIPFAVGGVMAIAAFWIRGGLAETEAFASHAGLRPRGRTLDLLRLYPRQTAAVFALSAAGGLAFYAYTTYMQKFLVNTAGFGKQPASAVVAAALVVYMAVLPLVGLASDRLGRRRVMAVGLALGALATYPAFVFLSHAASAGLALAVISGLVVLLCGYSAVNAAVKAELYPKEVRALGVSVPYALANVVFGGTAEYVALWLKQHGREAGFYVYVAVVLAIAAVVAARLPETKEARLD